MTADPARRLQAQRAWHAFCERLKDAGDIFMRDEFPIDELDVAEGLRYLGRVTHASIERYVDGADPARPYFYPLCNERIKVGGDNPDNRYYAAAVSDRYRYQVHADFRGCSYYSLVVSGRDEIVTGSKTAKLVTTGLLNSDSLVSNADGTTDIAVGGEPGAVNHLPLDPRSNLLIVRCTIEQGNIREIPVRIDRADAPVRPAAPSTDDIATRLMNAADHLCQATTFFAGWTAGFQQHLNRLPLGDQAYIHSTGGDPNIHYYLSAWRLEPQQALVFHIRKLPPCRTWNLQLCNVWMESLDYTSGRIHVNSQTAQTDADAGITIVASDRDPGHRNWISTQGHTSGTIVMRLTGASEPAVVETRVVAAGASLGG